MGRLKRVQGDASCEVCGNEIGEFFEVCLGRERHVFDSFECAIHAFTLTCENCGCHVVGQGVVLEDRVYCSYECANEYGTREHEARVLMRERANL